MHTIAVVALVAALGTSFAVASPAGAATVTHGPQLGAVEPGRAQVLVATSEPAWVTVQWTDGATFDGAPSSAPVLTVARPVGDLTARLQMEGLPSNRLIYYRVVVDGEVVGSDKQFRSFPISEFVPVKLCFFADFAKDDDWPGLAIAIARGCQAIITLGDMPHANPDAGLKTMRGVHRTLLENHSPLSRSIVAALVTPTFQVPIYSQGDDHDLLGDDTDGTSRKVPFARQAYREWHVLPGDLGPGQPLWQAFSYGRTARILLPDTRTSRSPKRMRDGPDKTILGDTQRAMVLDEIATAPERWVVLGSGTTWNPTAKRSLDAWGTGYQYEKGTLLATGCERCLVVSGDLHSGGALDDGTTSGWPEGNTPRANACGNLTGKRGTWSHGGHTSAFDGIPIHGYLELTLTETSATFEIIWSDGRESGLSMTILR